MPFVRGRIIAFDMRQILEETDMPPVQPIEEVLM